MRGGGEFGRLVVGAALELSPIVQLCVVVLCVVAFAARGSSSRSELPDLGTFESVALLVDFAFSITANALTFFVAGPRVVYGMADRGLLPNALAHVAVRLQMSDRSILSFAVIVAGICLGGRCTFLATVTELGAQMAPLVVFAAFVLIQLKGRDGHATGMTPLRRTVVSVGVAISVHGSAQAPTARAPGPSVE